MDAACKQTDDFEPLVFEDGTDKGRVLLLASNLADLSRMQGFLVDAGFSYQPRSSQILAYKPVYFAVIVCHSMLQSEDPLPTDQWGAARVIVVSDNCEEQFVISTLAAGANYLFNRGDSDYVLAARLESALRQHGRATKKPLCVGDIQFDIQKRVVSRAGKPVDLSPKEFDFAYYLFCNSERIVGNNELMTSVWSLPADMDTRRIDTAACRARKKLNLFHGQGWELKRIRKVGYRLEQVREKFNQRNDRESVFPTGHVLSADKISIPGPANPARLSGFGLAKALETS